MGRGKGVLLFMVIGYEHVLITNIRGARHNVNSFDRHRIPLGRRREALGFCTLRDPRQHAGNQMIPDPLNPTGFCSCLFEGAGLH